MSAGAGSERERIIQVATRLFADLGFDGTPGGMIAEAAGVDTATLLQQTGGTLELYHEVMRRAHLIELAMLEDAVGSMRLTAEGLREFADTYLDFHLSHPHVARLWLHRWLGDAAGSADLESEYERPLTDMVAAAVRPLTSPDLDVDYMLWTLVWAMTGFVTYGVPNHDGKPAPWRCITSLPHGHRDTLASQEVARFRSHMHLLIERVLQAPGSDHPPSL
ncbi:Putative transcriptional regulator%2C TetR family [Mycobacterium tuberculosis]|nr:Putative transcriptional regulator%2C TetR family [Mycobacterium tuberculosis]